MQSFSINNDYEYQLISLPSTRLGVKYRFKAGDTQEEVVKIGLGINFMLTHEFNKMTVVNNLNDDISAVIQKPQTKLSVGLSVYF